MQRKSRWTKAGVLGALAMVVATAACRESSLAGPTVEPVAPRPAYTAIQGSDSISHGVRHHFGPNQDTISVAPRDTCGVTTFINPSGGQFTFQWYAGHAVGGGARTFNLTNRAFRIPSR
jgi:hypothetical protein